MDLSRLQNRGSSSGPLHLVWLVSSLKLGRLQSLELRGRGLIKSFFSHQIVFFLVSGLPLGIA